jgi:hypothetical protein
MSEAYLPSKRQPLQRNSQVTEASARPWQAGASPRFMLPFSSCALAKYVPTWIAWVGDAPGEMQNSISFLVQGAAVSDPPPLSLLHRTSPSHVAQYNFQSGPGRLSSKSAWGVGLKPETSST